MSAISPPTFYSYPNGTRRTPFVPVDELIPCCGFLCCLNSFICKQPTCSGCYSRDVCCCFYCESICCKETNEPGFQHICYRSECMKGSCHTCRQTETQCLCLDSRCSANQIPEQPCICTILFFTFYFDNERSCRCCIEVGKLKEALNRDETRASNLHQIIEAQLDDPTGRGGGGRSTHGGSSHGSVQMLPRPPPVATLSSSNSFDVPEATVVSH